MGNVTKRKSTTELVCFAVGLLLLATLVTCSASTVFAPKSELLVPWSEEEEAKIGIPPYAARYEYKSKRLVYAAVPHVSGAPNPVFTFIDEEMDRFKPEVVVFEGLENALGFSPSNFLEGTKDIRERAEFLYAAHAASDRGVPCIGGEPADTEILKRMEIEGYSLKDNIFYNVFQQIPQWKRQKQDETKSFEELYAESIKLCAKSLGVDPAQFASVEDFKAWFEEKNREKFDYEQITEDTGLPDCSEGASYIRTFSCLHTRIRDEFIVGVIAEMLNRFSRVFVVYGSGHHVTEHKVLEEMLGKPTITPI